MKTTSLRSVSLVLSDSILTIELSKEIDIGSEIKRLESERLNLVSRENNLLKRVKDHKFLSNAPQEIIDKEIERLNSITERKKRIDDLLNKTIST